MAECAIGRRFTLAALLAVAPAASGAEAVPSARHEFARVWLAPSSSLDERVAQARRFALQRGLPNLDAAARALLLSPHGGSLLERAEGAVVLAPDLPAAHAMLASARLRRGELPGAARAAAQALGALGRHLEGSLWAGATAGALLVWALAGAGLFFLTLSAARAAPHAAHDLGDRIETSMPAFARAGFLGALVLIPAALGEGLLGLGAALLLVASCYASRAECMALGAAALLVIVALHPIAHLAARFLSAPRSDVVADAAYAAENSLPTALALARLERAAPADPLALRALALAAKREGALAAADARYRLLLDVGNPHPSVVNNAANVRLALGDVRGAIELYSRAAKELPSPITWFNLAQAQGRAIEVEAHEQALARAQALDPERVRELTALLGETEGGYAADLPLAAASVRARMVAAEAPPAAAALRRALAPGLLGGAWWATSCALGAAGLAAGLLRRRLRRSGWCPRCGVRLCPRCPNRPTAEGLCQGCARLRRRPETTDPGLRAARVRQLRRRAVRHGRAARAAALVIPGNAGLAAGHPGLGLVSVILAAGCVASAVGPGAVVPDPLAAGGAGTLAFGLATVVLATGYGAVTGFLALWKLR